MPATHAQVFGPTTVNPGLTTTGEKTLLTMSTTFPAGGKNVIIAVLMPSSAFDAGSRFRATLRIKKGATILYETYISQAFNYAGQRAKPVMLLAVDNNPAGNDSYTFTINITSAGSATGAVHVQGMVIKTDDAGWAYNTTGVLVSPGFRATITSLTTAYPANSKVVALMFMYGGPTPSGQHLVGAGNVGLRLDTTVISSSQFNMGGYGSYMPFLASLVWLGTVASSSQTWVAELTNGSTATYTVYAEIVTFTVADGAFLDTGSVALTSGTQVTVGSLSTTLTGDVVVVGLAAAENTGTSDVTAFNANDVVLQKDNSSTGQIANLVEWLLERTSYHGRSGILPLLRCDTGVSNPSYQIKMTARASGINGEAKIAAFILATMVGVSDSLSLLDVASVSRTIIVSDAMALSDAMGAEAGVRAEDHMALEDYIYSPRAVYSHDSASLEDYAFPAEERMALDTISLSELFRGEAYLAAQDLLSLSDWALREIPIFEARDGVKLEERVAIWKGLMRVIASPRIMPAKRALASARVKGYKRLGIG